MTATNDEEFLEAIPEGAYQLLQAVEGFSQGDPALAVAMLMLAAASLGHSAGVDRRTVFQAFDLAWLEVSKDDGKTH